VQFEEQHHVLMHARKKHEHARSVVNSKGHIFPGTHNANMRGSACK